MDDAREIVARAAYEAHCAVMFLDEPVNWGRGGYATQVLEWKAIADAAIAAIWPLAMEMAAAVAQRYLAADAHNVAMPMLRERYGDESCEHASEHLRMASESVPAAIRAITPPQVAAMEEGK